MTSLADIFEAIPFALSGFIGQAPLLRYAGPQE